MHAAYIFTWLDVTPKICNHEVYKNKAVNE